MECEIVTGTSEDALAVTQLMGSAFDPRFGEAWTLGQTLGMLAMPGALLLLAKKRSRLLGFALARTVLDETELMLLAVDPQLRRLGIGDRLVDAVCQAAQARNAVRLHLEMRKGNGAVELYRRRGFEPIGERLRYYRGATGEVFDAQTFVLRLNEH